MVEGKKIREITGFTHKKQVMNVDSWYENAILFHRAAKTLYRAKSVGDSRIRPAAVNAALSLELLLKAILAKKKIQIVPSHNLRKLSESAGVNFSDDQKDALDFFTEIFTWVGRYPTPNKEEDWDEYHDDPQQKRKIRQSWGTMHKRYNVVRANPKTYPSSKNYLMLWKLCIAQLEGT